MRNEQRIQFMKMKPHPVRRQRSVLVAACSLAFALLCAGDFRAGAAEANRLTAAEKMEGWRLLFDGKSTEGWRSFKKAGFPSQGWVIEGDCLKHLDKGKGGDIITVDRFQEFDLRFEWRIAPGANSGLKYFITEERNGPIGHEYQIIDDERHADGLRGGKWQTASFYDCLAPSSAKKLKPPGEFNSSRVLVRGNHVEHWLNGEKVLEYTMGSPAVKEAIANSKFKTVDGFGTSLKGHILLQDHGDEVCYRNIKIRDLSAD